MGDEIERAASALYHIDAGCPREEWIKAGMGAKAAGLGFEDFHNWSASAGNYASESECRAVWKSFDESGGVTPATLFGMAFAQGWQDPSRTRTKASNASHPSHPVAKPATPQPKAVKSPPGKNPVEIWNRCIPATPDEACIYLKQGKPDGLRVYPASAPPLVIRGQNVAGYLAVPCWDGADLQTLQFIPPAGGDKLNLPGASFGSGFFTVGEITDRVYICEGIGQAWACNAATGAAAVVTFGAGRMNAVALALREKHPAARLVLVPDRGKEAQAEVIAAAVAGQWVAMPADKPSNYDANDYAADHGSEALAALLARPVTPPIEYPLSVAFADELPGNFTPPDEVVQGLFTAGDGSLLFGDSNSGKTFFAIDLAAAVARGIPWMGRQTEPGLVVYLAAESPASVRARMQAYQKHHGVKVPNFAIVQNPVDLFAGDADMDAVVKLVHQLERERGQRARLIIGDTLARLSAGANENAGQDMGLVVRRFDKIRNECRAHFLLIHHSGKNTAAGARGWSGLRAAVDTEIEVTDSPAGRTAEITKQRDLPSKGERIGFRLEPVTLGLTKWGAPATSCVVVPADALVKATGKRVSEVGGAVLEKLVASGTGQKKRELVAHFADRYTSSAVYRELKKLVAGGQVQELVGGYVRLTPAGSAN